MAKGVEPEKFLNSLMNLATHTALTIKLKILDTDSTVGCPQYPAAA